MGQAWCKEKSSKAQDSKSPLDRVFVRCAHRIYPGLKEDGFGATQRVTSSEIGYAGSPTRSVLLRGHSIDSVDRPFHPSEWVDVNLEVPCEPRSSVVLSAANQRRSNSVIKSIDTKVPMDPVTTMSAGAPVPPPRRRRRRHRGSSPRADDSSTLPESSGTNNLVDDDSDVDADPHYARVTKRTNVDRVDPPRDSDEEFEAIERSLQRSSLDELSQDKRRDKNARPKNHSTSSLPNVTELLASETSTDTTTTSVEDATPVERPPRHVRTTSLPRDASLFGSQRTTPERLFSSSRIDEDEAKAESCFRLVDNSIFEPETSCLRLQKDVRTSTPVKSPGEEESASRFADAEEEVSTSATSFHGLFESFPERSSESRDPSSVSRNSQPAGEEGVDRSASSADRQQQQQPDEEDEEVERQEEEGRRRAVEPQDAGYESKASSRLFSDGDSDVRAEREISSGIVTDVSASSIDVAENPQVAAAVQRTISEESLPREMLIEEIDDDDDDDDDAGGEENNSEELRLRPQLREPIVAREDQSPRSRDTSRRTSRDEDRFKTPPPSPDLKIDELSAGEGQSAVVANGQLESRSASPSPRKNQSSGTSMTPSLLRLEAALTDMLDKKDEEERERTESSTTVVSDKSPEPQIVPVHRVPRTSKRDDEKLLEIKRPERINPFNDLNLDEIDLNASMEEPPEKPSRLHRTSLIEDTAIENPLIVPTPPRRRHRSKTNLNSSSESTPGVLSLRNHQRHSFTNDRLI